MFVRIGSALLGLSLLLGADALAGAVHEVDVRGVVLALDQPAQRIVALAPHFVENLFAIGAGEQIVGTIASSDFPDAARAVTRVGAYNSISVEAILALKPDLVLAWQSGNSPRVVAKLEQLGVPVYVEEPRSLADISASLALMGRISGHEQAGLAAQQAFDERLAALRKTYENRPRLGVFYEVWHEPLQTLNGEHVVSALITLCGGNNVFADALPLAPQVSIEAVIARAPQVIIVGGSDEGPQDHTLWQRWPQLPAVKAGHIYAVRPDWIQRFTPRILDGTAQLCDALDRARIH